MSDSQRIDKWLWYARVAKTRTLAAGLVSGGKVRLNSAKITKPSHVVRPGDVVTVTQRERILVLRIETLGIRRGSATEARTLYDDLSPPPPPRARQRGPSLDAPAASRPPGAGRPTKRERRKIDAWKDDLRTPNDREI